MISRAEALDRFCAATSEAGFPPLQKTGARAWWTTRPLPLDVALKAVEVCGIESRVEQLGATERSEGLVGWVALRNRGCGCRPGDRLALLALVCVPEELAR